MKKKIYIVAQSILLLSLCLNYGCKKDTPVDNPTPVDTIVGSATVTPSSGVVGTNITFTVKINDYFTSKVTNVWIDISNTSEHIAMKKVDNATWSQNKLWAPTATSYPRTDTFTFTAFDTENKVLGHGSATFIVLSPTTSKSMSPNVNFDNTKKSRYYGENE